MFTRKIPEIVVGESAFAEMVIDLIEREQGLIVQSDRGLVKMKFAKKNQVHKAIIKHLRKLARNCHRREP